MPITQKLVGISVYSSTKQGVLIMEFSYHGTQEYVILKDRYYAAKKREEEYPTLANKVSAMVAADALQRYYDNGK